MTECHLEENNNGGEREQMRSSRNSYGGKSQDTENHIIRERKVKIWGRLFWGIFARKY